MNSLLLLLALSVSTAKPADVAYLALEKEAAVIAEPLRGVDQRRSVGVRDASAAPPSASGRLSPVIYGRARTTEGIDSTGVAPSIERDTVCPWIIGRLKRNGSPVVAPRPLRDSVSEANRTSILAGILFDGPWLYTSTRQTD